MKFLVLEITQKLTNFRAGPKFLIIKMCISQRKNMKYIFSGLSKKSNPKNTRRFGPGKAWGGGLNLIQTTQRIDTWRVDCLYYVLQT